MAAVPRRKVWEYPKWISEHAFDKLRLIDCIFSEFELALESAEVFEETEIEPDVLKELLLLVEWKRPLHVVVIVDRQGREERMVTVYEPHGDRWSSDYRERR